MSSPMTRSELRSWLALTSGMKWLWNALDRQLRADHGISHDDYQILVWLSRGRGRALRMSDIARDVGISPSRLSHAVTRMEAKGWVERMSSARDRRVVEARLTKDGTEWVRKVSESHLALVKDLVFDTLGPDHARSVADAINEVGRAASRTNGGDRTD